MTKELMDLKLVYKYSCNIICINFNIDANVNMVKY